MSYLNFSQISLQHHCFFKKDDILYFEINLAKKAKFIKVTTGTFIDKLPAKKSFFSLFKIPSI